ncbi:MAG: hypothetical protein ACREJO_04120 [Phycisphaerales bacterium]
MSVWAFGVLAATSGPLAPGWVVAPVCALAMLATAAHVWAVQRAEMPASRRRIRTVTGLVLLVMWPLLGIALSGVDTADRRRFVLVWMVVMGLVVMAIALAVLDMLNSARLAVREKRELMKAMREELKKEAEMRH